MSMLSPRLTTPGAPLQYPDTDNLCILASCPTLGRCTRTSFFDGPRCFHPSHCSPETESSFFCHGARPLAPALSTLGPLSVRVDPPALPLDEDVSFPLSLVSVPSRTSSGSLWMRSLHRDAEDGPDVDAEGASGKKAGGDAALCTLAKSAGFFSV